MLSVLPAGCSTPRHCLCQWRLSSTQSLQSPLPLLDVIGGGFVFLDRNDKAVLERMGGSSDEVTAWALMSILVGLCVLAVAAALWAGSNLARYFIAFIALVRVLALLYALATFAKGDWYDALVPAVVYALVAGYLLFDKDSQAFFARRAGQV